MHFERSLSYLINGAVIAALPIGTSVMNGSEQILAGCYPAEFKRDPNGPFSPWEKAATAAIDIGRLALGIITVSELFHGNYLPERIAGYFLTGFVLGIIITNSHYKWIDRNIYLDN